MSITSTIHCDMCGAERKQTNHWFSANLRRAGEKNKLELLRVFPLGTYVDASDFHDFHLCGIECACKFLARELAK